MFTVSPATRTIGPLDASSIDPSTAQSPMSSDTTRNSPATMAVRRTGAEYEHFPSVPSSSSMRSTGDGPQSTSVPLVASTRVVVVSESAFSAGVSAASAQDARRRKARASPAAAVPLRWRRLRITTSVRAVVLRIIVPSAAASLRRLCLIEPIDNRRRNTTVMPRVMAGHPAIYSPLRSAAKNDFRCAVHSLPRTLWCTSNVCRRRGSAPR